MNLSCVYKAFCACCCLSERCIDAQLPGVPILMNPDLKLATVAEEIKKIEEKVKDQIVEITQDICLNPETLIMENLTEIVTEIVTPLKEEAKKSVEIVEKLTPQKPPFENYIKSYFN
jgi:superfamily II helicase